VEIDPSAARCRSLIGAGRPRSDEACAPRDRQLGTAAGALDVKNRAMNIRRVKGVRRAENGAIGVSEADELREQWNP